MNNEKIFEILNDWNYWNYKIPKYYSRNVYENLITEYDFTDEITIIKGIRRSGKSTLLVNHIKNLMSKGVKKEEILFVNFEDPRFGEELTSEILDKILETYKEYINNDSPPYIFLDEIQNVSYWEKWVRTIYELKKAKKVYVTGSSSKLLSKEFGTSLSGRFLDLEVSTLSFKEFLSFNEEKIPNNKEIITNKIKYKKYFNRYLEIGGFPKIILSEDNLRKKEIIIYYETIILKDIVARYNLKNYDNVKKVATYLISNIAKPMNLNNIKTSLNISYELVDKYFEYLKDTYLVYELNKFDYSLKKQYSSSKKVYSSDISFINNIGFKFSEDLGRALENIVFLELKRNYDEIYYHQNNQECDFIIKEELKITQAIQVTDNLNDEKTRKREIDGLMEAMKTYNLKEGLILTKDEEKDFEQDGFKIKVKPIWKWLLENTKGD